MARGCILLSKKEWEMARRNILARHLTDERKEIYGQIHRYAKTASEKEHTSAIQLIDMTYGVIDAFKVDLGISFLTREFPEHQKIEDTIDFLARWIVSHVEMETFPT